MGETASKGNAGRRALLVLDADKSRAREADAAVAALTAGGITLVQRPIESHDDLGALITSMRHDVDCVILAGSDGLMNAAAIALRDTGLPLGVLPFGARRALAHSLAVPDKPEGAAAVILAGATRKLDLGSVNGRPFFGAASVGMTVAATERLAHAASGRLGVAAFMLAATRAALTHRRYSALLRCDNDVWRIRTLQIAVGNGRFYAPDGVALPHEGPPSHPLCVFSLEPDVRANLVAMASAFGAGEHDGTEVRVARGKVVEIVTRASQSVSVDGEVVTVTPARFSILRDAVTVYAPAAETAPSAEAAMAEGE